MDPIHETVCKNNINISYMIGLSGGEADESLEQVYYL